MLYSLSECKKNPNFESESKNEDKKVSFAVKLSNILLAGLDSEWYFASGHSGFMYFEREAHLTNKTHAGSEAAA